MTMVMFKMKVSASLCECYHSIIKFTALIEIPSLPDPFRGIDSALQTPISASSDTVCTPQASNTSSPPDPTPRKSAIHKAFLARQKRWETEQASELSKCEKFLVETCGCTLADGAPCSTLFKQQYIMDTRAQCFFLSRDQLDMLILGSVVCTICEDDDVGVRSGHKPTKRQRTTIEYVHKAYSVCRKTFTFLHGISKHKLHAIKIISLTTEYPQESMETLGNSLSTPLALTGFWGFFNLSRIMLSRMLSFCLVVFLVLSGMM